MSEINYTIRPNKNVERKLIFHMLRGIIPNTHRYKYLGFGAFWFVDFILAHRVLGIRDLVSIERAPRAERARFNRPYRCIDVIGGDSTAVLPELSFDGPMIAWLDYQDSIDGPVLEDLKILCEKMVMGSVIIATLNAHRRSIIQVDDGGKERKLEESLRLVAGDLVPTILDPRNLSASGYPKLLATMLFDHLGHCHRVAGRLDTLMPLFNYQYSDAAPMITVGAALADDDFAQVLRARQEVARPEQVAINLPALTLKEKAALDQLLPCDDPPSSAEVAGLGFPLNESEIKAYHRYYLEYPVYGEVDGMSS